MTNVKVAVRRRGVNASGNIIKLTNGDGDPWFLSRTEAQHLLDKLNEALDHRIEAEWIDLS